MQEEKKYIFFMFLYKEVLTSKSFYIFNVIISDIPDTEIISSPIKQSPLLGEVSLLRLLHRMFSSPAGTVEELIAVDSALDICHQLLYTNQKHAALGFVNKLAEILGKTFQ